MDEIDWNKFSHRVPAGTIARSIWKFDVMLLENYPYSALEQNIKYRADWDHAKEDHQEMGEDMLKCQRLISEHSWDTDLTTFITPDCLRYLIGGEWKTFEQVMA
jgi:hypothetical protein